MKRNVTCDHCGKHHHENPDNVQIIYEQGDGTVRSENFCSEDECLKSAMIDRHVKDAVFAALAKQAAAEVDPAVTDG